MQKPINLNAAKDVHHNYHNTSVLAHKLFFYRHSHSTIQLEPASRCLLTMKLIVEPGAQLVDILTV